MGEGKKNKRKFKWNRLHIVTLFCITIILIPVVVAGTMCISLIKNYWMQSLLDKAQKSITYQARIINSYLNQVNITYGKSKNKIFFNEYIDLSKPDLYYEIREFLKDSDNVNELIVSSYFYDMELNTIHSSDGTYKEDFFFDNVLPKKLANNQLITDIREPVFVQTKTKNNSLLLLVYPFKKNRTEDKYVSYMIYVIDKKTLKNTFNTLTYNDIANFILYYNGNPIYSTNDKINDSINNNKIIDEISDNNYYFLKSSDETEIKVATYISKKEFKEPIYRIAIIQSIIIFIILAISILILIKVLKNNYLPIRKLIQKVKDNVAENDEITDEYIFIDYVFDELLRDREVLEELNDELEKEKYLYHLIRNNKGHFSEKFVKKCNDKGLAINEEAFLVVIVNYIDIDSFNLLNMLSKKYINSYHNLAEYQIKITESQLICLFAGRLNDINKFYEGLLVIDPEELEDVFIGVGSITRQLNDVYKSFNKAQKTSQYGLENNIYLCFEIDNDSTTIQYPNMDLQVLKEATSIGQFDKALFALKNLRDCIKFNNNMFLSSCIYNDILYIVDNSNEHKNIKDIPSNTNDIIDKLNNIIKKYESDCKNTTNVNNNKKYRKIAYVIEYIDKNYRNINFSIKYMANYMGTTQSNLSQYFKKYTGKNISDYIDALKINYAKKLLEQGAKVGKIAEDLGYSNSSAFIKKFKKREGVTPGEYKLKVNSTFEKH